VKSWFPVPIPILIPVNRGANPGYFPDPGQIGIGAKSRVFSRSRPNRDRENPGLVAGYFPGQIGAGRGGIRGYRGLPVCTGRDRDGDRPESARAPVCQWGDFAGDRRGRLGGPRRRPRLACIAASVLRAPQARIYVPMPDPIPQPPRRLGGQIRAKVPEVGIWCVCVCVCVCEREGPCVPCLTQDGLTEVLLHSGKEEVTPNRPRVAETGSCLTPPSDRSEYTDRDKDMSAVTVATHLDGSGDSARSQMHCSCPTDARLRHTTV
jgi:hypothetical protein